MDDPWGVGRIPYIRIRACIHVYTGLYTHVHIRVLAVYAVYPVFRAVQALCRPWHVQACNTWGEPFEHVCAYTGTGPYWPIWAILGMGRPPNPDMG